MKHSPLVVVLIFSIASALAQDTPSVPPTQQAQKLHQGGIMVWNAPDHPIPPFGSEIRKAVLVVREKCQDSMGKIWNVSGTAFVVAYHDPRQPADYSLDYLVTNRHVAQCMDESLQPRKVLELGIEANLTNGRDSLIPIDLRSRSVWYFPADPSVDLAVTPIVPGGNFHPTVISLDSFFTKDDFAAQNIGEGAKIIFSGYFYQIDGTSRLQPLVREGILSMIPDTPVNTTLNKPGSVYLADVHVFGGNSGSPVFISLEGVRPTGIMLDGNYRFLGIVSGYYIEDADFKLKIATTVSGKVRANSGISIIVPSDCLRDLILSNHELVSARDLLFPRAKNGR